MTPVSDAVLERALRERREAIEERDRLRAALLAAESNLRWIGDVNDGRPGFTATNGQMLAIADSLRAALDPTP